MTSQLFALERYETSDDRWSSTPQLPLDGAVRLVTVVRLANDDVVLALVEGPDSDTTAGSMAAAGWRVDRITPATWLWPAPPTSI